MLTVNAIFEKTYRDYLGQISNIDLRGIAEKVNGILEDDGIILHLFGKPYRVSPKGIFDKTGSEPDYSIKIVLARYLIFYPPEAYRDCSVASYRDFKDSGPFRDAFHNNVEIKIAERFSGNLKMLEKACLDAGGKPFMKSNTYDLGMKFKALPDISMILLFNDADEVFCADGILLFEKKSEKYLDMECLAGLGWIFMHMLKAYAGIEI